jgi:hypothetical protein
MYLNPFDLYLALSIWLESHDWENFQNRVANPLGLTLNVLCLISRANSGRGVRRSGAEDVLRRPGGDSLGGLGSGLSYFVCLIERECGFPQRYLLSPFQSRLYQKLIVFTFGATVLDILMGASDGKRPECRLLLHAEEAVSIV